MTTTTASINSKLTYPIFNNSNNIEDITNQDIAIQQQSIKTDITPQPVNGLVRRLSVTARPGDIFYKVKDVTDSSTTDTLQYETNDYAEIDNFNDEEKEIIIKPITHIEELQLQQKQTSVETVSTAVQYNQNGTKKTSWNVKRHQTTSLGINQPISEPLKVVPKDDIALIKQSQVSANLEPGSPQFTKELLSIR